MMGLIYPPVIYPDWLTARKRADAMIMSGAKCIPEEQTPYVRMKLPIASKAMMWNFLFLIRFLIDNKSTSISIVYSLAYQSLIDVEFRKDSLLVGQSHIV